MDLFNENNTISIPLHSLKKGDKFTIGKSKKEYEFIWVYTMNGNKKAIYWNQKGIREINSNINLIVNKKK